MSSRRAVWICCDGHECESQFPADLRSETASDARARAYAQGWRKRGRWDLCEGCVRDRNRIREEPTDGSD